MVEKLNKTVPKGIILPEKTAEIIYGEKEEAETMMVRPIDKSGEISEEWVEVLAVKVLVGTTVMNIEGEELLLEEPVAAEITAGLITQGDDRLEGVQVRLWSDEGIPDFIGFVPLSGVSRQEV